METLDEASQLTADFEAASAFVRGAAGQLQPQDLLFLYGRYKQALEGPCNTARPGFFDFQGKQKWDAWHDLGSLPSSTAMQEYVQFVDERFGDWRDPAKRPKANLGARVSTMAGGQRLQQQQQQQQHDSSSAFDCLRCGEAGRVRQLVTERPALALEADAEGQTLLHWAADRGDLALCQFLLDTGADPNQLDAERLSPLHAACAGGSVDVVQLLLGAGADPAVSDSLQPADLTSDPAVLRLFDCRARN